MHKNRKYGEEKGKKLEKKIDTQDQESFRSRSLQINHSLEGALETREVTKKIFTDKSIPEVFKGQMQASGPSGWRRHFDLSPCLKESRSRSHI